MGKKYRIGMIGVGGISPSHQKPLSKLQEQGRCEVIGIYDIDPETQKKRCAEWGYKGYESREAMLADKPDALWVMTPVFPRIEIFKAGFEAGCHIFTEKPLALNNKDAETCVKMAKDYGKILGFGCNERHSPPSYTMWKIFNDGTLGSLIKAYAQTFITRDNEFWAKKFNQADAWRLSFDNCGGRIFEFSIHLVNWLQWIGGDPVYVAGCHDAVSTCLAENNLDDVVSGLIRFKQGFGHVETIMAPGTRPHRSMGIIGTKGECYFDETAKKIRLIIPGEKRDEMIDPIQCTNKCEDFLDALDEGRQPRNDCDAALATTRICSAFNESVFEKKMVVFK